MYSDHLYYNYFTASAMKHCYIQCTQKSIYLPFMLSTCLEIVHKIEEVTGDVFLCSCHDGNSSVSWTVNVSYTADFIVP